MSLESISAQLGSDLSRANGQKKQALPPIELWDPPYCGEIDLQIKADGRWFYNGTVFKRLSLVQLFASVLKRELDENTDDYFLVTPVEKVKISVEDAPFVLTQWQWLDGSNSNSNSNSNQPVMQVTTSLGDEFILDEKHPLTISSNGHLYVTVRRNLLAKIHRNVYYQWVDLAKEVNTEKGTELMFFSDEQAFSLGLLE